MVSNTPQAPLLWIVVLNGRQYGPFSEQVLLQWVQAGKINAEAELRCGHYRLTVAQFLQRVAMVDEQPAQGMAPVPLHTPPLWGPSPPQLPQPGYAQQPGTAQFQPGLGQYNAPAMPVAGVSESDVVPMEAIESGSQEMTQTATSTCPATGESDATDDQAVERDQIVIIGRRQSGKTIYLASIYSRLWRSLDGLTAKALTGETHRQLMEVATLLKHGEWPSSTTGTTQVAMEIEYHGRKRLMVALDFAGELFSKAFVREHNDEPGVKELLKHIDSAAGVMLLVDPSIITGKDADAAVDDDFGMVQAVQRIRNWPGGDEVPIVLILTKMDMYQHLIDRAGGVKEFVRRMFPALVRLMKEVPMFQVSAVQASCGQDGKLMPRPESSQINVENPLRYCLAKIEKAENDAYQQQVEAQRQDDLARYRLQERKQEHRHNMVWTIVIVGMLTVGAATIALLVMFRI